MNGDHNVARFPHLPWMERAECRGIEQDPPTSLCFTCAVRIDCLSYALEYQLAGTWGGHSDYGRAALLDAHAGNIDEAIIASHKIHAVDDARARHAAMARHPSASPQTRAALRAQLELDFAETHE